VNLYFAKLQCNVIMYYLLLLMITGGCFQLWQDSHNDQWWYGKRNKNSEFSYAMPNMCVLHMHIHHLCFSIPLVYSLSQVFFLRVATTINVYFQAKNENPSSTVVSGKDMSRVLEAPTTPTMALYAFRVTCFVLQGQSMTWMNLTSLLRLEWGCNGFS
jgi:hypothetical protein